MKLRTIDAVKPALYDRTRSPTFIDEEGNRYGHLEVLIGGFVGNNSCGSAVFLCKCRLCGSHRLMTGTELRRSRRYPDLLACVPCTRKLQGLQLRKENAEMKRITMTRAADTFGAIPRKRPGRHLGE